MTFWIAIVFWCIGTSCGLAATSNTFSDKLNCEQATQELVAKIKGQADIVEGRCSKHYIPLTSKNIGLTV